MMNFLRKIGRFFKLNGISVAITAGVIAVAVVLNTVVYYMTSLFGLYLYKPETDDLSLSGATDSLFAEAIDRNKTVNVTFCMSESKLRQHDTGLFVITTLDQLVERHPGFINVNYVNILTEFDDNGNRVDLEKYAKDMRGEDTPLNATSVIFSSGEGINENYRVVTDTYSGAGFADFFTFDNEGNASAYIGEEVLAAMICWVLHDEHKVAYFTSGHGEMTALSFANLLSCAGYYVDTVNLRDKDADSILAAENTGMVIISEPSSDFERAVQGSKVDAEIEKLDTYLSHGGKLYVAIDPYVKALPVLEGFLSSHGITLAGRAIEGGSYAREMVTDQNMGVTADGLTFVVEHADGTVSDTIAATVEKYGKGRVLVSRASRIIVSGEGKPLLLASKDAVCTAGAETVDTEGGYCVAAYSEIKNEYNDNGYMFVASTSLLTNADLLVTNSYSNKDFVFSVFEELFDAPAVPYGCKNAIYNTAILENLTMGTARTFTAILIAIPVVLAGVGAFVVIRRRRR